MLSNETRVDPRVTRTRALLSDALRSLLDEKSFEDITVLDIAARATVNRATFYAHFTDKYAMVDDLFRDLFARGLAQRQPARADSLQGQLRQLFLATTDHVAAVRGKCRPTYRLFESLIEAQVKALLRDQLCDWLLEHPATRGHGRLRLELAATLVSWSIYAAALEWTRRALVQPAESFADEVVPLLAATVAALGEDRG
jgi:AcrR family transcriptional regulator